MKQAIWYDSDMAKAAIYGIVIGFVIGVMVGYELGWQPIINTFRPLVG
jgi:hypothetical protein